MKKKLTVAIPSFNRNNILKTNIVQLLPQLTDECDLLVLDNASDIPLQITLDFIFTQYPKLDCRVIRNRFNVGMTANILKCFEYCTGSWLWVLGDDDKVMPDAVQKILKDINTYHDYNFINYAWDSLSLSRSGNITTVGIDQFVDSFETVGIVLFISSSVYNVDRVSSAIAYGNFFQTSYAPHLVILLMSIKANDRCLLSNTQIVINNALETPDNLRWDMIFIYQITLLLRLPLNPSTIAKLRSKLAQLTRVWTIAHFIYVLTFTTKKDVCKLRPIVLYNDVVNSFFSLDSRITSRILCVFGKIIIRYPSIFKLPMRSIYKALKGHEFDPNNNLRI